MAGLGNVLGLVCVVTVVAAVVGFLYGFDSLEYTEIGLNYSWLSEKIEPTPYSSGRHFLGPGNHFIKFPKMLRFIFFVSDSSSIRGQRGYVGPALSSRTKDGLQLSLEVSFQYKLKYTDLYKMYSTLGPGYEHNLVRMAIETLTVATTRYDAHFFFTNRSQVVTEMERELQAHFDKHAFSDIQQLQLRGMDVPKAFQDALAESQEAQQGIKIAGLEQKTNKVTFHTEVLKAEQAVKARLNEADGEVGAIKAANDAFCKQYEFTQELQAEALEQLMKSSGWTNKELLDYLKVRAVREHPSNRTTINL